jgi:hypothetical protein
MRCDCVTAEKVESGGRRRKSTMNVDKRRFGVIKTRFHPGPPTLYQLTIGGVLWAAVEWSPSRRCWCVEDAAGHCLAHCEHVHDEHLDMRSALALARRMIVNGTMPTPEEAEARLAERRGREGAGEPLRPAEISGKDDQLLVERPA